MSRTIRPIFIVAPPFSGAEELVETLAAAVGTTTLPNQVDPLGAAAALRPAARGHDSARLGSQDAKPAVVASIERAWDLPDDTRPIMTWPSAALQIPFLRAAWPGAYFVFVQRDPLESLAAMLAAWESQESVTHPDLPGWDGLPWSLPLTPEWRGLVGAATADVVADQWRRLTEGALADLRRLPSASWTAVSHHDLLARPETELGRLGEDLGLRWDSLPMPAPVRADRAAADRLLPVLPRVAAAAQRARESLERGSQSDAEPAPATPDESPYRSVSTPNFAALLEQAGSSLLVSTYQSGRVVLVRADDGRLNTHFRSFEKPMGIAHRQGLLALGTRSEVWTFQDLPDFGHRLPSPRPFDACYVPRSMHHTGDIRIHDLAWAGNELWAVNTRFSCLVTFDAVHSFVPRWRPAFISGLAPEDRCHLNGLAVVEDRVKYVTALGTTDTEGGWRPGKARGGVIIDVESDHIVASGLSMPHSPRWYRDRLWVLESGEGTLSSVDVATGAVTPVAHLPGFTRGLAFLGRYAFVGLSEVREATTFGGLPLTGRLEDRQCGVWIVDLETGQTMGFLRFEDRVQEIFDIALLADASFPEILPPGADELLTAYVVPREAARRPPRHG